jgi:alpha-L-fucosidase
MKRARDAGMRYFVITSKHHDGFAMYRSQVSKFNIGGRHAVRSRRHRGDRRGLPRDRVRLGLYYSQDVDWSDPDGGGEKNEEGRRVWGAEELAQQLGLAG